MSLLYMSLYCYICHYIYVTMFYICHYIVIYVCRYIYMSLYIYVVIYICHSYIYVVIYIFTTEGLFEVAIESWPEWDLNPRPLNSVQTL